MSCTYGGIDDLIVNYYDYDHLLLFIYFRIIIFISLFYASMLTSGGQKENCMSRLLLSACLYFVSS